MVLQTVCAVLTLAFCLVPLFLLAFLLYLLDIITGRKKRRRPENPFKRHFERRKNESGKKEKGDEGPVVEAEFEEK